MLLVVALVVFTILLAKSQAVLIGRVIVAISVIIPVTIPIVVPITITVTVPISVSVPIVVAVPIAILIFVFLVVLIAMPSPWPLILCRGHCRTSRNPRNQS
jgi:hypothetical protein